MPLSIVVRLRHGRYDAAALRPSVAEWPPHPARLFCALVASAVEPADWSALRWLEAAGEPEVWASSVDQFAGTPLRAEYAVAGWVPVGGAVLLAPE